MIYLDNAATGGHKPDSVLSATRAALENCANPGRSGHKLSLAASERVLAARTLLSDFFGGYGFDRVIFTKNCTEGLNIAILGGITGGAKVVTTVTEHNSVLRPLHFLKGKGVKVEYLPLGADGGPSVEGLFALIKGGFCPDFAVINLASNVTGSAADIAKIREILPKECILICDGAQACGHVGVSMRALGIDALAVAGHKGMLGVQGSGALLLSDRFNPSPILFGGTGSDSKNPDMPDFYPDRAEAGTLNFPAIVSLAEGAMYLDGRIKGHMSQMLGFTAAAEEELKRAGAEVYSKPNPYGITAFGSKKIQSEMLALALSERFDICVRGGLHCAPLMHRALGSDGLVRASFSPFTPKNAPYLLAAAVKEILGGI